MKKLVEKWGISIFKGLIELILWHIAQILVNFCMSFGSLQRGSKGTFLSVWFEEFSEEENGFFPLFLDELLDSVYDGLFSLE